MTVDYKDTVCLPHTDFPMRAGLPKKEPALLERWAAMDLYATQRADSEGREKFILHDGPPYANGHLHIGHALNKILKDVINRSQQMLGKDADYVPGWDCHGLPIEWKVEERYRAAGRNKDEVPNLEFRRECREFAEHWVGVQSEEFQRLGVIGDWKQPYATMDYAAEAQIAREIAKFAMNGGLYRGSRPVLWSVPERTALADAEVEYHEHKSPTIYVRFPVVRGMNAVARADIVIWTTTPWTIPGNRAIAVSAGHVYVRVRADDVAESGRARVGDEIVVAEVLLPTVLADGTITAHSVLDRLSGAEIAGTICAHPLRDHGYAFDVPVLTADFVTMDQGTGFVHVAPGHGEDDWHLGRDNGIEVPMTVGADGAFYDHVPLFAGKHVLTDNGKDGDANGAVIKALAEAGALLAKSSLRHNYPHSWRSKAPLIFRNTSQWFISMATNDLRDKALTAIGQTRFVPAAGRNRLHAMIESRPDWCVSRQRAWGVPIAVFVRKDTGELLRDQAVFDRIAAAFETEGGDAWFASDPSRFLGPAYRVEDYEQVTDIVEVWFESGCTHSFVLEKRPELTWPASLYLEGSDQHRGWFHSSLLESCGTRGRAPYDAVLTHGFVQDGQGRKMSKSLGNTTAPQDVIAKYGADILRIWVVSSDYSEDLRIGQEILKYQSDLYRRIRNTFRFLLGNLDGFDDRERVAIEDMPEIERWVLHRLWELDKSVRQWVDDFDFHNLWMALHNFCSVDLSAFYFDIRKDSLYCDHPAWVKRRACRTVLDALFDCLAVWLAPILCFTTEEAWLTRHGNDSGVSVHRQTLPDIPASWRDDALAEKWRRIRRVRRVLTGALEIERAERRIGSSLEAAPTVYADADSVAVFDGVIVAEVGIVSSGRVVEGAPPPEAFTLEDVPAVGAVVGRAQGQKCVRCYQVLEDVGHTGICGRCAQAVDELTRAA